MGFPCTRQTEGRTSSASIPVPVKRKEMIFLAMQYASEMQEGVFTVMNHVMPLIPNRGCHRLGEL